VSSILITRSISLTFLRLETSSRALRFPSRKAKELKMEYPAGWLWVLIGIGVIVLGAVIVWNIQVQRQRRLSAPEKREQNEVIKENYQKGG
jgi:hypothetical protein